MRTHAIKTTATDESKITQPDIKYFNSLHYSPSCRLLWHRDKKSWPHGVTNVSIPEVNMLKNSSTLAVSVPINLSIKLSFVCVNGNRET